MKNIKNLESFKMNYLYFRNYLLKFCSERWSWELVKSHNILILKVVNININIINLLFPIE